MSRDRFFPIRNHLKVVIDANAPPDYLFKIRQLIERILQ